MRSRHRGRGTDLAGSRPYRAGDDVRRIDWRTSARLSSTLSSEEFVVREYLAEEATDVVLLVDRSPSMALFPDDLPWLSKPEAAATAGSMIVDSALRARCRVGYLDDVEADRAAEPASSWQAPVGESEAWRVREIVLSDRGAHTPARSVGRLLEALASREGLPAPGAFVFVLSDFLEFPPDDVWRGALARGWDLVPVVIQDPTWERSFPNVGGALLPIADPVSGRPAIVRLRKAEADERRRANEARLSGIVDRLSSLGLVPVQVTASEPETVLDAFLDWSESRHHGMRLAR
jgi:hypothetical protein